MLKIAETPRFTHDVPIDVPVDGGHDRQTIRATFEVIPDAEFDAFDTRTVDGIKDLLRRLIVSLDDVVGEDDAPMPYSEAMRDRLLALPYLRVGLLRGYNAAMLGARTGN